MADDDHPLRISSSGPTRSTFTIIFDEPELLDDVIKAALEEEVSVSDWMKAQFVRGLMDVSKPNCSCYIHYDQQCPLHGWEE